jgi:hypothetical protein
MMAFFTSIAARLQGWAVAALALVAAIGGAFLWGRSKGSSAATAEAQATQAKIDNAGLQHSLDTAQERNDVDIEISRLPDGGAAERLQRDWPREGD